MKKWLCSLGIALISLTAFSVVGNAQEDGASFSEFYSAQQRKRSTPDFDLSVKLRDTENRLLDTLQQNRNISFENLSSLEYLDFLTTISNNGVDFGNSDRENIEFSEFAGIYSQRMQPYSDAHGQNVNIEVSLEKRNELLDRDYQSIRDENINSLIFAEENALTPKTRAAWNVTKATSHARTWAYGFSSLYPRVNSDCTNFVSQIALMGGKEYRWTNNKYGMSWWQNRVNWSNTWTVAHDFTNYWTLEGATVKTWTSKTNAQAYATEGTFIAYWKKNTFQITHMAYVSKKSGGNAYITQHTKERLDEKWNSIDTSDYESFITIRF